MTLTLLHVEDEADERRELSLILGDRFRIVEADSAATGWASFERERPDVVLLDHELPDGSGLDLLRRIRASDEFVPCVFLSVREDPQHVISVLDQGATDYLGKASNRTEIIPALIKALRSSARLRAHRCVSQRAGLGAQEPLGQRMVGSSAAMVRLREEIDRLGPTRASVVIRGESGTGKELVARALHEAGGGSPETFIAVLICGVADSLLRDALFGHERHAFTGADRARVGCIEAAHGGTLFLNEVGDVSEDGQGALLRVLQERTFHRQGGEQLRARPVDFRLISDTSRDLDRMVREGSFRVDFFHRIRQVELHVPPLRERLEDIPELAELVLRGIRRELERPLDLENGAVALLREWEYRDNNVRELQNIVAELAYRSRTGRISRDEVRRILSARERVHAASGIPDESDLLDLPYNEAVRQASERFQRRYVNSALERAGGTLGEAARLAGISRQSLGRIRTRLDGSG